MNNMATMEPIKCCVVGDGAVGKTCLLVGYTTNVFPGEYIPTIFDSYSANALVDKCAVNIVFWDTPGQEDYDCLRPLSYSQTDVFVICFAVNCVTSFENVRVKWYPDISLYYPGVPIILVGTKTDLRDSEEIKETNKNRKESKIILQRHDKNPSYVTTERGMQMAKDISASSYIECSALQNRGLQSVFDAVVRAAISPKKCPKDNQRCVIS